MHADRFSLRAPAIVLGCALALSSGSEPSRAESEPPAHCRLELTLEPKSGQLDGRASFSLPASERVLDADNRLRVRLHPDLVLRSIRGLGRELAFERFSDPDTSDGVAASRYLVAVDEPSGVLRLDLEWSGTLRQDLAAGEKAGQIHNREMNAHIGSDGVYLAPDASWHPRLDIPCIWTLGSSRRRRVR